MDTRKPRAGRGRLILLLTTAFLLACITTPVYAQIVQIDVPMNGAQEVPPLETVSTGLGRITVNLDTGAISGTVTFSGLSSASTAGHIHMGATGVNGPVIVPLLGGLGATAGTMTVPPGTVLPAPQIAALRTNGLYLNIHTTTNLNGEIRGQILFTGATPVGSVDAVPLVQLVSGNFDPTRLGSELAGLSVEGSIFVSLDLNGWAEIPGEFIRIFTGDFDGDGTDDLGGVDGQDGAIRITTDFGITWTTVPPPLQ
ncbi:MAG: CHRD domain-containing protein [Syntrophobacteraceae bacterium]